MSAEPRAIASPGADDDRALAARILGGERQLFATLVARHQRGVFALCLRMVGNPADAEELAQETFVRAWRALASYDGQHRLSTWIYRIALNACRDLLRSKPHGEQAYGLEPDVQVGPGDARPSETPLGALQTEQLRRFVERGLARLPGPYREVLVLRENQGLSYEEISRITGDTVGALKVRAVRARDRLLQVLEEMDPRACEELRRGP